MLTERAVERSWGRLFKGVTPEEGALEKAEALLEELRPESPLRLRLANELEELRGLYAKMSG